MLAVGLAGIWLAYGLFQACSNIVFMMLMCVVLGTSVFFFAEWLSMVSPTLFMGTNCWLVWAASNHTEQESWMYSCMKALVWCTFATRHTKAAVQCHVLCRHRQCSCVTGDDTLAFLVQDTVQHPCITAVCPVSCLQPVGLLSVMPTLFIVGKYGRRA
jgi:hypothetical protein